MPTSPQEIIQRSLERSKKAAAPQRRPQPAKTQPSNMPPQKSAPDIPFDLDELDQQVNEVTQRSEPRPPTEPKEKSESPVLTETNGPNETKKSTEPVSVSEPGSETDSANESESNFKKDSKAQSESDVKKESKVLNESTVTTEPEGRTEPTVQSEVQTLGKESGIRTEPEAQNESRIKTEPVAESEPQTVIDSSKVSDSLGKRGTKIQVRTERTYRNQSVVQDAKEEDDFIDLTLPDPNVPLAKVSYGVSLTLALGEMQFAKISSNIELPSPIEEVEEAFKFAKNFVDERINGEAAELRKVQQ